MKATRSRATTLRWKSLTSLAAVVPALAAGQAACSDAAAPPSGDAAQVSPAAVSGSLQQLSGHRRPTITSAPAIDRVPASTPIHLTIGLPVDDEALARFAGDVSDPASATFGQYLSVQEFADRFGASREDYAAVVAWARSKNLTVTPHDNRVFVRVSGSAGDVERAFNVHLEYALRPDGTRFYRPDAEPALDLSVPVRFVSHLDDYDRMRAGTGGGSYGGNFMGKDYRDAYVPGSPLTGAGQWVGIFADENTFWQSDINTYNAYAGMTPPLVQIVGTPGTSTTWQDEITLDIDSAQSMAPNAQLVVFNGSTDQILAAMVENTQVSQFSSSFFPENAPSDPNWAPAFAELAAQGQSFFNCSGDSGAYGPTWTNMEDVRVQNFVTVVGGTNLTLSAGAYAGETVWNGSSGGVVANSNGGLAIPSYQLGINPSNTSVSNVNRNLPDVSALASNVAIYLTDSWHTGVGGTSVASPTWAGFMALVNQHAVATNQATIGFANPALYAAGKSAVRSALFNDVTSGNNVNSNGFGFSATAGYDLDTGLGTPKVGLINALAHGERTFQALDLSDVLVLGSDANLWLEHGPFGTVPPPRQQIDGNVMTFQALDASDVVVLGSDGNLWFEHGPFGTVPPPRQEIDVTAQAFQAIDDSDIFVLGTDGNLWLEYGPYGTVPPARVQVDYSVLAFQAIDTLHAVVLGNDGNLWLEYGAFGRALPPSRWQIDANVKAFSVIDESDILVLGTNNALWLERAPFGTVPPARSQVDGNVRAFAAIPGEGSTHVYVLGTNGNLWFENAPFGTVPPNRYQVDGSVTSFRLVDGSDVLVRGSDGNLWLEHAPWGSVPPARQQVDGDVAL